MAKVRSVPINGGVSLGGAGSNVDFTYDDGAGAATFTLVGKVNSISQPDVAIRIEVLAYDSGSGLLIMEDNELSQSDTLDTAGNTFSIHNGRSLAPGYQIRVKQVTGPACVVNLTVIGFSDTAA